MNIPEPLEYYSIYQDRGPISGENMQGADEEWSAEAYEVGGHFRWILRVFVFLQALNKKIVSYPMKHG